ARRPVTLARGPTSAPTPPAGFVDRARRRATEGPARTETSPAPPRARARARGGFEERERRRAHAGALPGACPGVGRRPRARSRERLPRRAGGGPPARSPR